ncbi:MAG: DUF58 domain-containing protein [Pseudonocardiales bacterium]|nr:MAG: DUF58 domain-containing protein [Pseudonocardiales bacterium]
MPGLRAGFTTRASCLIAAGGTALLCGLLLGEVDLVRAGVLALAVPLAAAFVVFRSRVRIANRRSADPARASAGEAVAIHLAVTNRSMLRTGSLMLEDQLPQQLTGRARFVVPGLAGRETRTVSYRMPSLPRGRYRAGPLRIRLADPFRMIDITRSFTATTEFVVTPIVDSLPSVEPPRSYDIGDNAGSHSIGTHGADDASTREYRTGDDLRKIHWRSSARTGALMVRQEERPWQGQITLLLDTRTGAHVVGPTAKNDDGPTDPRRASSLEWAISAAASIGTHLLITGRDVGLIDDLAAPGRLYLGSPGRLGDHLATVRSAQSNDLSSIAGLARSAARDSALIAVLGLLDSTSLRVLAEAHPRGAAIPAFALLLDTQTWLSPPPSGVAAAGISTDCDIAARVLRAAGWSVVVVGCGQTTPAAWQNLLRAGNGGAAPRAAEQPQRPVGVRW